MTITLPDYKDWIGRIERTDDVVTVAPLRALAALLDRDDAPPRPGDTAPPLAHWLYFLPAYRQSDAGPDGHAARGGFLPPVPLPRRMWAGSRLEFVKPLRVGAEVTRISRIKDVTVKEGRSGTLAFVTVRHEVSDTAGLVLTDEHDIVYRGESGPQGALRGAGPQGALRGAGPQGALRGAGPQGALRGAGAAAPPTPAPGGEAWSREIRPDPLLLFRYSAVTFNGHRIHYDHPYTTKVEGYPGLVVHGPLIATLLVDLLRRNKPDAALRTYTFRALRPLFDTASFHTCGAPDDTRKSARLWTRDSEGAVTMDANATWT